MSYGLPGPGRHITIYANAGHAYMVVDGRRFDTSAIARDRLPLDEHPPRRPGYAVAPPAPASRPAASPAVTANQVPPNSAMSLQSTSPLGSCS